MKIAAAQTMPQDGNIQANMDTHLRLTLHAADNGARLIIFPEMSLIGYMRESAADWAFTQDDQRLQPLKRLSVEKDITIIAGAPLAIGNSLYIGALIISPDDTVSVYTKQFLHPGEEVFFESSFDYNPLLDLDGEKISIAICADVNNPLHPQYAHARQAGLYIAGIFFEPQSIDRLYRQLADYSARFNMKILMANYGGPSYALDAAGRSAFWNDSGELVAQLETTGEEVLIVEI